MKQEIFYPRLCGGTFFTLVLKALKRSKCPRGSRNGHAEMTAPNCLVGLIRVIIPDYEKGNDSTFFPDTSNYKSCKLSSSYYLSFEDEEVIKAFDSDVKQHFADILARMNAFTLKFIEPGILSEWLVKALIELIQQDKSISENDIFYVTPDGYPTKSAALTGLQIVLLPAFLLGVWHYIVTKRPDNHIGEQTYKSWHEFGAKGGKPKFISTIGNNYQISIEVEHSIKGLESKHQIYKSNTAISAAKLIDYSDYLTTLENKYRMAKTFLYKTPIPFSDFYVCNRVRVPVREIDHGRTKVDSRIIEDLNIEKLRDVTNFAILTGTGGLGKSMMMRNLVIDAIHSFKNTWKVPVFINLRDYSEAGGEIANFIYEQICQYIPHYPDKEFKLRLIAGDYILILDGLDEIDSANQGNFETGLDLFYIQYPKNLIIVSARPFSRFQNMTNCMILNLLPFTKEQALKMIGKLDYQQDVKDRFSNMLDKRFFKQYKDFAENPLLLTIMLIIYKSHAEIPKQIHVFYEYAYEVLSRQQDEDKEGNYQREWISKLTPERYKQYLSMFCAISYTEEKYDFSRDEAYEYFQTVKRRIANPNENGLTASAFMDDLCNVLCLMYEEGGRFYFIHRSFQEYFTAYFMAHVSDEDLHQIGDYFEDHGIVGHNQLRADKTFIMFFDMHRIQVERFILRPFLEELFKKCPYPDGYWKFLSVIYESINLAYGSTDVFELSEPTSFLYDFIVTHYRIFKDHIDDNVPYDKVFALQHYIIASDEDDSYSIQETDDFHWGCFDGALLIIDPEELCKNSEDHTDLYQFFISDECTFKKEFDAVYQLLLQFRSEQDKPQTELKNLFF